MEAKGVGRSPDERKKKEKTVTQEPDPAKPIEPVEPPDVREEREVLVQILEMLDLDARTPEEAGYGHGV
jgi:hypothetical protein